VTGFARTLVVFAFALSVASSARGDDSGVSGSVGPAFGGSWMPGGLRIGGRYELALDPNDWLEAGGDLTVGYRNTACHSDASRLRCNHAFLDGDAIALTMALRHDFDDVGGMRPFIRAGVAVSVLRFPDDVVMSRTDGDLPRRPTEGMYGVAVTTRLGAGTRFRLSPDFAMTAAVDVEGGAGGFAGTADAHNLFDVSFAVGAELRPDIAFGPRRRGRLAALAGVLGIYAPFITWEYYAWYHGAHRQPLWFDTATHDELPLLKTYAGGADKAGHAWIHYTLTRGTTELLVAGRWDRLTASLICFAIDQVEATFSEMKDGPVWGYEVGDSAANLSGALLGVLMENIPTIDRLFDFRLEYWPSHAYLKLAKAHPLSRGDGLDISQDYTGQSYMLAMHLGALPYNHGLPYLRWLDFTDAVLGFQAMHYEPVEPGVTRIQTEYGGISVNMQALLSALFRDGSGRRIGRGIAEVYSLPYTTLRLVSRSRTWTPTLSPSVR
jgi:opacity protein-like surface antigen